MADWNKVEGTGNVEDRRTASPGLVIGGVGGLVVLLAAVFLGGKSPILDSILNQVSQSTGSAQQNHQLTPDETAYKTFASKVLASTDQTWKDIFSKETPGTAYTPPKLVLFRQSTAAGCGQETSDVGPNYCNADATIYLDETFFDSIYKQFGGSTGDVAQAYVIAHEVGHHVQDLQDGLERAASGNTNSVKVELQADCYAGVWARHAKDEGIISQSEMQEAVSAASSVGDDHIQKQETGQVRPESFTHGTSAQRVQWLNTGYTYGTMASCDTFD